MTLPVPATVAVGDKETAALWNGQVRDPMTFWQNPPRCSLYQTGATNMTTGVGAAMLFDTELYDTDGMHSTASLTSRITIVTPGMYHVEGIIGFASNATGWRLLQLEKNGAVLTGTRLAAASGTTHIQQVSFDVPGLVAGDYLELFGTQTSGSTLASQTGAASTMFSARWVAAS